MLGGGGGGGLKDGRMEYGQRGKPQVTGSEEGREGGQCVDGTTLIQGGRGFTL